MLVDLTVKDEMNCFAANFTRLCSWDRERLLNEDVLENKVLRMISIVSSTGMLVKSDFTSKLVITTLRKLLFLFKSS